MQKAIISGYRQAKLIEVPDLRAKEDVGCGPKSMPPQCVPNITPLSMVTKPGKVEIGDRVVVMPQYPCGRCSLCIADDYIHCYNFLLQWVGTRKLHYGTVYLEAVMDVAKDSSRCLLRLGLVSLLCIRIILQCVRENEGGFIQHSLNYRSWPRRFGRNYQRLISWSKSVCGGRSSMANGMCTTNECRCCRQSI